MNKTFNVLIATTGRPSLQRMLNSLLPQLTENDALTIVFDGMDKIPTIFNFSNSKCKIYQYNEPVALGFWGHGIRNKYANLLEPKDFIMHADDDDLYEYDTFDFLRNTCIDSTKLYICLVRCILQNCIIGTVGTEIKVNKIGTQCGIIPYEYNKNATWQLFYGGDGMFYEELNRKYSNSVIFLKKIIYWHIKEIINSNSKTKINLKTNSKPKFDIYKLKY
jgi:hypothetical protein